MRGGTVGEGALVLSMLRAFPGMTVREVVCDLNLINIWAVGEYMGLLNNAAETETTGYRLDSGGLK